MRPDVNSWHINRTYQCEINEPKFTASSKGMSVETATTTSRAKNQQKRTANLIRNLIRAVNKLDQHQMSLPRDHLLVTPSPTWVFDEASGLEVALLMGETLLEDHSKRVLAETFLAQKSA